MNPKMLQEEKKKLEQKLEHINALTTAPLRYIEYVKKHGTPLGKTYKQKLKAA